jgi:PhnB protein
MKLNTYLNFDGDCRAAFEFYAQLLGGDIVMMMPFGESPACDGMSPQALDKIMHARLVIGDDLLMGTDATPGYPHQGINGAHVTINVGEPAEADRIFAALAEGGKVELPIQETFWARRYGITVDRFGVPWMINCEQAA